ncbi:MAG: HNH endonuclease [Chloroflexi bacterium]|nr:HNH endonuclease [Chloroflexota bacterium]
MDLISFILGTLNGLVIGILGGAYWLKTHSPVPRLTGASWRRVREMVRRRDDNTCQYCGQLAPNGEADHVLPLAGGGRDSIDNLVWCCPACNRAKGSQTLREWIRGIKQQPFSFPDVLIRDSPNRDEIIDL